MRKLLILLLILLGFSSSLFSQVLPKNSLNINKAWWSQMTTKHPGFHGTFNRWMSSGDFNKDGLPDIVLQFAAVGSGNMY